MTKVLQGIIHGKTIELENETGLEDGRKVEITLRAQEKSCPPPGWKVGSTETAAGLMAACWTDEDDQILEEIHRERKKDTRREILE